MTSTAQSLNNFVNYTRQYITGDEKGQAQVFLENFFRAFGHEGALQAGATYEERIHKGSKKGKTGFTDLVWKPRVLIEMKKRGADLSKHYSQAFDYWQRAVPNRPRYVMLCNFDEFWIYDFDTQIDTPIDMVLLAQLPERASTFGFMEVQEKKPVFGNNQVEVTEKAAGRMGELFQMLQARLLRTGQAESLNQASMMAQRYVLQCVLAMFAEDRGLLPGSLFVQCVQDCLAGASSYDVIGGLFREMNTPGITPAGRYQGVEYFNGGLFSKIHLLQLTNQELKFLEVSALEDWGKIRPAIFGNIFESAIDQNERHAHGIHYTSEADIMKIVRPTISRYWEERIDQANTIGQLETLQLELQQYRVLDPACGSGNFLYIAYQELKQIEQDLLDKIAERRRSPREQIQMGFVTPLQLFGIDNNPFAVELARVTLMIARKVAIDRLGLYEPALPLDTLDRNIVCQDALFTDWPKADAIIGNPPFLGGKHMRLNLGDEYVDRIFEHFPDVKDSVDFCSYWFRLSQDRIGQQGRAGLVATNSISQGKARIATLDYVIQKGGVIHEAISSQPWSGEANVHVSIVNWSGKEPQEFYLDNQKVPQISSSLKGTLDVSKANRLRANLEQCFQGVIPLGEGFIIDEATAKDWGEEHDSTNFCVVKPFSMGGNLARNVNGEPDRWVVDFFGKSIEDASWYLAPFAHVKRTVKPIRDQNRRKVRRDNWWIFGENAPKMRRKLDALPYYFAVPEVSKWAIFVPSPSNWLPGNKTKAVASDDFYVFGVLTSETHRIWMHAQKSTLEDRIAYTHNTCFETFPFPQAPAPGTVQAIRAKALELHQYRSEQMEQKQWGITKLYNAYFDEEASQLYKLHKQLDALVLQAYGFSQADDLLARLLELNLTLADREQAGEPVVGPWAPTGEVG
ncbi:MULTISPECIES: DNA methyltransferase [Cyanophyceae]|uniref:site-specific DNA-methyltransferase (adenine-specific) n=1 Tax=Leptolyngbya subtilissima DQ-A4 TaxID=2933933 RepID=A0ABV0KC49_9CYAN|nr:DNA methyltransferase [Nodosilinea sp. FACHB-141]MBD2115260.1 class I SAM-dependent DNA methyltransferase [Nodosilinea sp. FACHB-141]